MSLGAHDVDPTKSKYDDDFARGIYSWEDETKDERFYLKANINGLMEVSFEDLLWLWCEWLVACQICFSYISPLLRSCNRRPFQNSDTIRGEAKVISKISSPFWKRYLGVPQEHMEQGQLQPGSNI